MLNYYLLSIIMLSFSMMAFVSCSASNSIPYEKVYSEEGVSVINDDHNNSYIAGFHFGGIELNTDIYSTDHDSSEKPEIFVAKFQSDGNLDWSNTLEARIGQPAKMEILAVPNGDVYVTGNYSHVRSIIDSAIFLKKFDLRGNLIWSHEWPSAHLVDAAPNNSSNGIFIAIKLWDEIDLDPSHSNEYVMDGAALIEFDNNGNFEGHRMRISENCYALSLSSSMDSLATCSSFGRVNEEIGYKHYLRVFDLSGTLLREYIWTARDYYKYGDDGKAHMLFDQSENLIVAGAQSGRLVAGEGTIPGHYYSSTGTCLFAVKFNSDGNVLWDQIWQSNSSAYPTSVAVGEGGSIYIIGFFYHTVDFDPGEGVEEFSSNGDKDIFLIKLTSSGQYEWTRTLGGRGEERANDVVTGENGEIFITGMFSGTVDLDPGSVVNRFTSVNANDAFLLKLDAEGNLIWARTWGGENARYYD